MNTLLAITLALTTVTPRPRQTTRATFITHRIAPDGGVLAIPIHTPGLWLRPDNAVAKAIEDGEALKCRIAPRVHRGTVDGEAATISTIVLDCDGAKFTVLGIQFEGAE